jgi:hypothetical protein
MTSAAGAGEIRTGALVDGSRHGEAAPRGAEVPAAGLSAHAPVATWGSRAHDATLLSLLGCVQLAWLAALAYWVYRLAT